MTTTREPRAVIRGLDELVQAIPYLLGFHPTESLVLIGLDDGHVVVTARADLDDVCRSGFDLLADTVHRARAANADAFVVAVYTGQSAGSAQLAGADVARAAEGVVVGSGGRLLEAVLVRDGRCWSYLCDGPCCPAGGRVLPAAPSAFVTQATVAGTVVAADRAAKAAVLDRCSAAEVAALEEPLAAAENAEVAAVLDGGRQRRDRAACRALFAAARASHEPGWVPPGSAELSRYAVALTSRDTRDAYWYAIEERRLDGRPLLCEIARRCPSPYDTAALFLFGWVSWRAGNGMLADLAATRALDNDPGYSAAGLLHSAVVNGLDPHSVPRLRRPRGAARR